MKSKMDTEIQFSGLKPGRYEYTYTLDREFFEGFENENLSDGTVYFRVILDKTEREMMFSFSFHGLMKTQCDRCLGEMEVHVEGKEQLSVHFSDQKQEESDEEVVLPTNAYKIDLAQWMYEYVAVAMPQWHTHEIGDCDPAMLDYLADEEAERSTDEVDPRWAKLLELK